MDTKLILVIKTIVFNIKENTIEEFLKKLPCDRREEVPRYYFIEHNTWITKTLIDEIIGDPDGFLEFGNAHMILQLPNKKG